MRVINCFLIVNKMSKYKELTFVYLKVLIFYFRRRSFKYVIEIVIHTNNKVKNQRTGI